MLVLFILSSTFTFSQIKYADRLFEEEDFESAAPLYEKILKKDSNDLDIIQKLGKSYQRLNRYEEAEKYYAKAVQFENADPESHLNYGQLLKNGNKINQAKKEFQIYLQAEPEGFFGKLLLKSCDKIGEWTADPTEFQIYNLEGLNTKYLESFPFPYGDQLIFMSNKSYLLDENGERPKKAVDGGDAFDIYVFDSTKIEQPIFSLSDEINKLDDSEGPAYLDKSLSRVYYVKTYDRQRNQINQNEIHIAHLEGEVWTLDDPFPHNSKSYSCTNPVLSPDGKRLYFASDMGEDENKMDIYVSEINNGEFSKPQILGGEINTPGYDIPSYVAEDGTLYFYSSYHPGFGGFDIFKTRQKAGTWTKPENIKAPFNSSKDDIGFVMTDSISGYFSSDRDGGKGKDDIYYFTKHYFSDSSFYTDISGVFLYNALPMDSMTLTLLDENDEIVQTLVTNEKGEFTFRNVPANVRYKILIDEDPDKIPEEAKIYLTDDRYNKIMLIERLRKGLFQYEALARDDYMGLSLMDEVDDVGLPTFVVMGELSNNRTGEKIKGKRVYVVDQFGQLLGSAVSDHLGKFKFEKLSMDDQYLFKLEEEDIEIDISILNKGGNVIGKTMRNKDGIYVYHKFTINPSGQPDIRGLFKYGTLPADGVDLFLLDENDQLVQVTRTNVKGEFEFKKLDPGSQYKIQVDSLIEVPGNATLFLLDKHTGMLMPVSKLSNGLFKFETLAPIPPQELALMEEEDYVLKPRQNIRGVVTNSESERRAYNLDIKLVNKKGMVMAVAKTNDKGEFKFFNLPIDDQYLFTIPDDDVNFAIKLINNDRKVLGEAKRNEKDQYVYHKFTINPSKNPDIRGMFKYGELPANDVTLNLLDEGDEILSIAKTDQQGVFSFKKLKAGKTYRIQVDESEGPQPNNSQMYIQDEFTGLMLPVSKLANGSFKFETLAPMEVDDLELIDESDVSIARFSFFGMLFSKLPMDMPEGMEIYIVDDNGNIIFTAISDRFGKFNFQKLPLEDEYLLRISEDDPDFWLKVISEDGQDLGTLERNSNGDFVFNRKTLESQRLVEANNRKKLKVPASLDGPNVRFDFNSHELNNASKLELDKAVATLKSDSQKKIEISSHTDSRGPAAYNMWLSEQRSNSIRKYLMSKGVPANQIIVNNYGETKPLNECADGVPCSLEKHAENRRTELKIRN
ncbi:MAG: OmpA family protein [Vicingaceae bacterium]